MNSKNILWLFCGIGIGFFAYWWWIERQRLSMAVVNLNCRLFLLEQAKGQGTVSERPQQSNLKWWLALFTFALSLFKLLAQLISF